MTEAELDTAIVQLCADPRRDHHPREPTSESGDWPGFPDRLPSATRQMRMFIAGTPARSSLVACMFRQIMQPGHG